MHTQLSRTLTALGSMLLLGEPTASLSVQSAHNTGGNKSAAQTGSDVSWPQCSKKLPSGQLFGIVGVNGGRADNFNSCFADELSWAEDSVGGSSQDKAALYVNTANPGNAGVQNWPVTGTSAKYGTCYGGDDQACAFQYGWQRAAADAQNIGGANPTHYKWWLDVETMNSWETGGNGTSNNIADLEGMVDYFQGIGARVGLYSTAKQWGMIAGAVSPSSSLYGLDSWLPGGKDLHDAKSSCKLPALTGGRTVLTQYIAHQIDYNYPCP